MDRQRGNALIIVLLILSVAGAYLALSGLSAVQDKSRRDQETQAALAQAKEALIGYAATYRDSHPNEVFGFLPCPDTNNDGTADACGSGDVSFIGRLPWKTLGLPPLRDSAGECLWYAVSGRVKNNPKTAALNWDTIGQFLLQNAAGNPLAGVSAHDRPLAVIIAPGGVIGSQIRPSAGTSECGGSNVIAAYLDGNDPIYSGTSPAAGADSTLTLATTDSIRNGTNNDLAQWITADDIFKRVRMRSDFGNDIQTLLDDLKACLDKAASPPAATGSKGFDSVFTYMTTAGNCPPYDVTSPSKPLQRKILDHWRGNLLYAKPAAAATVNGLPCTAVVLFGGARINGQTRANATEIDNAAKYLEAPNAAAFTSNTGYVAGSSFSAATPGADLARCITGVPSGAISFANNFSSFAPAGAGVILDATHKTVTVVNSAGATGGCAWYPLALPLAGKTLRAYYRYTFLFPDDHALTGTGTDRGNGFTFELVRADFRDLSPASPTPLCGKEDDMGALTTASSGTGADLALHSIIMESDVHDDNKDQDPSGNHTAIMADGNLAHSLTNGNATTACDASVQGCSHTPANKFEESPTPAGHNQRIEIATGCNSICSACTPATHGAINKYARIRVWVDCTDCADTTVDFPGSPNMQRCIELSPQLNSAYFGFTGGFQTGGPSSQGVTLQDFVILSQ